MIGKDENSEEQPVLKVTDRRKFNLDGSVRDGAVFEPEKPKEAEKPEDAAAPTIEEAALFAAADEPVEPASAEAFPEAEENFDIGAMPGEDDPASFVNFLTTLATNAAASLGAMPHPATGKRTVDLETGKFWIDVLSMLREKTKGNLHPQEAHLLEGLLGDLRMQYVQLVRATEEKLKQQAAQKFSAGDILGKK